MTEQDFERISIDAARALSARAAVVIKEKLDDLNQTSISDAIKVYEATNKRLGLNVNEKRENLPVIHWTINGGSITMAVEKPAPEAVTVEDVTPKPPPEQTPEVAYSLSFDNIEAIGDEL